MSPPRKTLLRKPKRLPALEPEPVKTNRWEGYADRFKRIINNAPTPKPIREPFEGSKYGDDETKED